jgi:trk system potassium uptake protein TrkH
MDFRSVASYLGLILEINGILTLIPLFISAASADGLYFAFLVSAILSFCLGLFLDRRFKKSDLTLGSAVVIAALSFILISLLGSIPFMAILSPEDALFESVSGFTTTGLTVVDADTLPFSLLFWRSFTQWIGGAGILVIFLALVGSPGMSSYYLYKAQEGGEKIEAGVRHTVRKIFVIYLCYTLLGILLYALAGMPFSDSVLVSFSSVSTGGFTPHNASIGAYGSSLIELVAIFMMILGGTSFFVHSRLWQRKFRDYITNPETKLFWSLIGIFTVLLTISFLSLGQSFRHGVFHAFSALTTTGFTTLSYEIPGASKFLIILLMIMGGYAGSTAGGLKLVRSGIILKSLPWLGKKISLPEEAVVPMKFGEKAIKYRELTLIALFVNIYLIIMLLSTTALTLMGYTPIDSLYQVASAEGTVGLSTLDISQMNPAGKGILMVNMLLGRLEIFPFLTLVYVFWQALTRKREEKPLF